MSFLTEQEFRNLNVPDSATEISGDMIRDCLETAADMIVELCGQTAFDAVANATGATTTQVRKFRKAQEKLAFRELLLKVGSRFRSGGVQVSEKDLNDSSVNTYEGWNATESRREALRSEAMDSLRSYLLTDVMNAPVIAAGDTIEDPELVELYD